MIWLSPKFILQVIVLQSLLSVQPPPKVGEKPEHSSTEAESVSISVWPSGSSDSTKNMMF